MQNVPMKVAASMCFSGFEQKSSMHNPSSDRYVSTPTGMFHEAGSCPGSHSGLLSELKLRPPPGLDLEMASGPSTEYGSDWDSSSDSEGSFCDWRDMREWRTTLHVRNLPCYFTRSTFLTLIEAQGLARQCDYLYLPMDFKTQQSIGYAFVNFRSSTAALLFRAAMDGFSQWPVRSRKVCSIQWSQTQGCEANVQLVLGSGVMNKAGVSEEYKPAVLVNGQMVPLSSPKKFPVLRQRLH